MPRSACASAGASFTPSPTTATIRPSAWSAATTSTLSWGSTSATTRSMPTASATARAVSVRSPVTITVSTPSPCRAAIAAAGTRLGSVGHEVDGLDRAVAAREHGRLPCSAAAAAAASTGSGTVPTNVARPTLIVSPSTTASTPSPASLVKEVGDDRPGAVGAQPRHDGPGDRMLRRVLRGRDDSAERGRLDAGRDLRTHERHPAGRDGSGLVEHGDVDAPRRLEHLATLDDDAELRAAPGSDHDRGGRREPERTGAGDDQHGYRRGERVVGRVTGEQPDRERRRARSRSRPARRSPTRGRPGAAPAPSIPGPRQRAARSARARSRCRPRVASTTRRPDAFTRRAEHRVADVDLHRDGLAGEHRHVDGGGTLDDHVRR